MIVACMSFRPIAVRSSRGPNVTLPAPPTSPTPPRWPHLCVVPFVFPELELKFAVLVTHNEPALLPHPRPAQVPDTATLAVLKQAINAKLAIPMDDMLLSKQPGLLTSKEPYSFRDMGINDASLKWVAQYRVVVYW